MQYNPNQINQPFAPSADMYGPAATTQPAMMQPSMMQQGGMMQPVYVQPNMIQSPMPAPVVHVVTIPGAPTICKHDGRLVGDGTMGCCSWICCLFFPPIGWLACCYQPLQDVTYTCTICGRPAKQEFFRCGFGSCCS